MNKRTAEVNGIPPATVPKMLIINDLGCYNFAFLLHL
jgi:hypothetical protein